MTVDYSHGWEKWEYKPSRHGKCVNDVKVDLMESGPKSESESRSDRKWTSKWKWKERGL